MFEATEPSLFLDYFRIPYRPLAAGEPSWPSLPASHPLQSCGVVRYGARTLAWPTRVALAMHGFAPRASRLGSIPIFAAVLPDATAADWLIETEGSWSPRLAVVDARGRRIASVWQDADSGSVFLPFDPGEAIQAYWSEAYKLVTARNRTRARRAAGAVYYRLRPAIPRTVQLRLRRVASRVQARASFPQWPVETSLHDLYGFFFGVLGELAREPVPWIAPWPNGYSWALVLTHDVETTLGYECLDALREVEVERGRRSSWNFVAGRYTVEDDVVRRLTDDGFEVGVHGLYHDGRDTSPAYVAQRLPAIRAVAERWAASGFRAPSTRRVWEVMPTLGFDYDSSYPDTDPFEPDGGGCCTWLPFFNGATVELPITLPQDHTLFCVLRQRDETMWLEKAAQLRERGGLALLITHPDYMVDAEPRDAYGRFLASVEDDATAWTALPRDVSAWWRRRAASSLERVGGSWQIAGPAAGEGRIAFAPAHAAV